jgi:predicted RNA binding protein YcfA (HicA-like mRNA interferase family)
MIVSQNSRLEAELRRGGFVCQAAKGSHRKWVHPRGQFVVISGAGGDDAKRYQEAQVERALSDVGAAERE